VSGRPRLRALELAEDPASWAALGFCVADGRCVVGTTELRLRGGGGGITGWELDDAGGPPPPDPTHPNRVVGVDHVVLQAADLEAVVAGLERNGLPCRGRRAAGDLRQAFHLLADALIEVVGPAQPPPDADASWSFWGLTLVCEDLDAAAALLGERLGHVKDAVQPGRRIATVRAQEAGVHVPLAFITPRVPGGR